MANFAKNYAINRSDFPANES